MGNTLKRSERLKKMTLIRDMFRKGQSFAVYPIRVVFMETDLESSFPIQVAVTVPKKNFKKAVSRNKIRRKVKEAYRLNKASLYEGLEGLEKQYAMMLLYIAKEEQDYDGISRSMKKLIEKFIKKEQAK